jgi:mannose-6-phosphate isomerase-like protein (cupin superfamily)
VDESFYIGSYRDDGLNESNRGWIVGKFKTEAPRKNSAVEIKYWEFMIGRTAHPAKTSSIIECTFILTGKVKGIVNNENVVLSAGDYIVIEPGVPNNLVVEILEDASGLTIKAPSDPKAKRILRES